MDNHIVGGVVRESSVREGLAKRGSFDGGPKDAAVEGATATVPSVVVMGAVTRAGPRGSERAVERLGLALGRGVSEGMAEWSWGGL